VTLLPLGNPPPLGTLLPLATLPLLWTLPPPETLNIYKHETFSKSAFLKLFDQRSFCCLLKLHFWALTAAMVGRHHHPPVRIQTVATLKFAFI
jgi:hypothetical protein